MKNDDLLNANKNEPAGIQVSDSPLQQYEKQKEFDSHTPKPHE